MKENENKYILSNEELPVIILEAIPAPENGEPAEFIAEAAVVAEAIRAAGVRLEHLPFTARGTAAVWGLYLLGAQRGAEAYRKMINAMDGGQEEAFPDLPFSLDPGLAQGMAEALSRVPIRRAFLEAVGL